VHGNNNNNKIAIQIEVDIDPPSILGPNENQLSPEELERLGLPSTHVHYVNKQQQQVSVTLESIN
jgi:hypothetical protein